MASQIDLVFESIASALPHVNAGRLRALGISTLERFSLTPQFPTINETGVKGFQSASWQGMCAPPGMAKPIVIALNRAIVQAVRAPETRDRLAAQGAQAVGSSPDEFLAFVKAEIPRWAKAIKESGAKIQ